MSGDSIADLLKPRNEVREVDHIEQPLSDDAPNEYTAFAHGRVGRRPQMMIGFRRCSGEVDVFPYAQVRRIHSEDMETGFSMAIGETGVCIKGQRLGQLFRYVCEHRVVDVVEADRVAAIKTEGAVVQEILITELP